MKGRESTKRRQRPNPPKGHRTGISFDLIEFTPGELDENLEKLSRSLAFQRSQRLPNAHQGPPIDWVLDRLVEEASGVLEAHDYPADWGELRWLSENSMDPVDANARTVILKARSVRNAIYQGDAEHAALDMMRVMLAAVRPYARIGAAQQRGARRGRNDALQRLLIDIFAGLVRKRGRIPTARDVIRHLSDYDAEDDFHKTVQEIDQHKQVIHWIDRRGRERSTSFKRLGDRLTTIRKQYARWSGRTNLTDQ